MQLSTTTPSPLYPTALRQEVRRAARLSHSLAVLVDRVDPRDACFVWLLGRHDEIHAIVGGVMREWSEGRIDERRAAERIGTYVRDLEEPLQAFFHPSRASAATVPFRPHTDTLIDG